MKIGQKVQNVLSDISAFDHNLFKLLFRLRVEASAFR